MKKSTLLLLSGLAVLACNRVQPNQAPDFSDCDVTVEPVITRATETNFETGDAIGLSLSREAGIYATNTKLTYDGSIFKGSLKWYAEGTDAAILSAYYPYQEAGVPKTFSVQTDQSKGTGSSDFLSATKEGVLPTPGAVTVVFKHQLSRLVLKVTNNYGTDLDAITVKGAIPVADIAEDLTANVADMGIPADISAYNEGNNWYAILPPQRVSLKVAASAAGVTLEQQLAEANLLPGKQYTINIIINPDGMSVVLSGDIENWNDGGEIGQKDPGEPEQVAFEEHLAEGYFLYDNVRYGIVKLKDGRYWMAHALAYLPAGRTASGDPSDGSGIWMPYSSDGTTATPDADGSRGYLYSTATALGVEAVTAENYNTFEGVQGICPTGWHIPTRAEYIALVGQSNKGANDSGVIVDESAAYYDAAYNGGKITALDADGFGFSFLGAVISGKYNQNKTSASLCSVESYLDRLRMNYILSSTANSAAQFFALMSTFTAVYPEGRLNVAFSNVANGTEVRCIRNAE